MDYGLSGGFRGTTDAQVLIEIGVSPDQLVAATRVEVATGQWSLLGISLISTLLAIPPTIYQSLMAYTAFADNPTLESAVFNSMSSWVFSFAGYYQPYWLLAVSSESRREIFRYFRRFLAQHVTPQIATNSKNLNPRVVVDFQSTMKVRWQKLRCFCRIVQNVG
ncbi:unnamed protein product, partial [Mesorhabditis belari]|uniref:Uncharacterized protein n=1 Tax=Mesorhabditis belari TaxID=2138241 RepID=A0AAF3ECV8_9BILA